MSAGPYAALREAIERLAADRDARIRVREATTRRMDAARAEHESAAHEAEEAENALARHCRALCALRCQTGIPDLIETCATVGVALERVE